MMITLVRHGEVDEAYHRCYNGHNDITLSTKGREEAKALSKVLEHQTYDAIYSSDLRRCRETTEHIISISKCMTPIYTQDLREKSWGRHEGMTFDAIVQRDGLVYENFEQWITTLDGEPYDLYISRIKEFFTQTLPQTPYNNVLVITHAGVIRVLMHLLQNISLEEAFSINFPYSAYTTLNTETWEFGAIQCA